MMSGFFNSVTEEQKNESIERIIAHASPNHDFFLMMTLAVGMAAFGVILENTVILIGSMLIAPLLYPILSLAMGIITGEEMVIWRSLYTMGKSIALAIAASVVIALLFAPRDPQFVASLHIASGAVSPLMYAIVAAIAGLAAAFATTKPELNDTLPGVAIAVSLVPPLSVAGIALALLEWRTMSDAIALFVVNVIGVTCSSMIVFALFHFAVKRRVLREAVKEEEKKVAEEAKE